MIRVVVFSDSHRDFGSVAEVVKRHREADAFIHLGDGYEEYARLGDMFPGLKRYFAKGNCDYGVPHDIQVAGFLNCGMARIFYTHGHIYNVKSGLDELYQAGLEHNANVLLYGHTHVARIDYQNGVYIMNPGSLGHPRNGGRTYGIIDVDETWIDCHLASLDPQK